LLQPHRYLSADEAASLDRAVARLEGRTGIQIVPAVVGKSDAYPEIPWHAFAAGAAFSALILVVADRLRPEWVTSQTAVLHATIVLAAGAACTLAAAFIPTVARVFLRAPRAEEEVRQYAESLFLRRGLVATRARTGVLLLVSLFERRIEIVADSGFDGRVTAAEWQTVVVRMTPHLAARRPFEALRDALTAIDDLLSARGFRGGEGAPNELPDAAIESEGA
jgi:putative membrane protein